MSGSPHLHPAATPDEEGMELAETLSACELELEPEPERL